MANVFVALPVPAGDGVGAWVDTSGMGPAKTVTVDGGAFAGTLSLEFSNDGQVSASPAPVQVFNGPTQSPVEFEVPSQWMRVRRTGSSVGALGAPTVSLAGESTTTNVFGALAVPAGDGTGAALDLSAGGGVNAFAVTGGAIQPGAQIIVEISTDGVAFSGALLFSASGGVPQIFNGSISAARVRRLGTVPGATPLRVSAGSGGSAGGGGAFPGYAAPPDIGPNEGVAGAAATVNRSDAIPGQKLVANWTLGICRVYALDAVNGNDAAKGFADPATSSAADYAIACAAAGAVARKTLPGLAGILPRYGAGRQAEIVMANTGAYAGGLDQALSGLVGYIGGAPPVRGTGTNANAGCVAFDGSAADCLFVGAVTGAGLNAAGYNPTGAPTVNSMQCLKVGGAAPAFAAEPAIPCGLRVRFSGTAETQALLRNQIRFIAKVAGGDTLTWAQDALPAVPIATDVFFVEQPGVSVGATNLGDADPTPANPEQLAGIAFGNLTLRDSRWNVSFCTTTSLSGSSTRQLDLFQNYTHPVRGSIKVGGVRSSGSGTLTACRSTTPQLVIANGFTTVNPQTATNSNSPTVGGGWTINGAPLGTFGANVGNSTAVVGCGPRIVSPGSEAGLHLNGQSIVLAQLEIINCGAKAAIWVECTGGQLDFGSAGGAAGAITGAAGNLDVGLDLSRARNCILFLNSLALPTVTGAAGDVRLANGQIVTWAAVAEGGFVDSAGNRFITGPTGVGVAGALGPTGFVNLTGVIKGNAGAATLSYLDNVGVNNPAAVVNATDPLRRPTGVKDMLRLRAVLLAGGVGNNCTLTLYKNGVATAMQITIPAGDPQFTKYVDTAHPIAFAAADDFDLRLDEAADAEAGTMFVSASLEYSI